MVELSTNQVRRGGYLAVALAFGALDPDSEVLHRVADRVVHASYRSCVSNDRAMRATARSMIDDVASGVIDRVCYCFDTPLDNAGASQWLIEWACELTTFSRDDAESHTDVMHSVRYHASLDYASLDVVPEARHEAFVALVYEVAKLREAELAATPEYLSEVVAAAHTSRTLYQRAAAWAQRTGRWVPALEDTLFPIDATHAEVFEALVNGPQMWHVANHSPHATIGYRYATNVDAGHRLARSPLAFWASLALAPEERFLCPDAGYDAAQVAWAVSRVPGNAEVTDLLTALDMAADSAGDA